MSDVELLAFAVWVGSGLVAALAHGQEGNTSLELLRGGMFMLWLGFGINFVWRILL